MRQCWQFGHVARSILWNGERLLLLHIYKRIAGHTELWTTCIPRISCEPWNMCLQIGGSDYIPILHPWTIPGLSFPGGFPCLFVCSLPFWTSFWLFGWTISYLKGLSWQIKSSWSQKQQDQHGNQDIQGTHMGTQKSGHRIRMHCNHDLPTYSGTGISPKPSTDPTFSRPSSSAE